MELYRNPELRKSAKIIVVVNIIMISILLLIFNNGYNKIKEGYLDEKAEVIALISEKYPEEAKNIIPVVLKNNISEEKVHKGLEIMKEYGYTRDINLKYMGAMYEPYRNGIILLLSVLILFMIIEIILNYKYHKLIFGKLRNLSIVSREIIRSNYDVDMDEYEEGEFSELTHGFIEMRDVIKNQMNMINEEKDFLVNLLSDISHQLKTPLASTILFVDILRNKKLKEEDRARFLDKSKIQLERIEWLIKSLLKLSKIDAKAISFNIKKNNLNTIIEGAIKDLEVLAERNNVRLVFEEEELYIMCDKDWIKEAIINIIKNAIEHSKNGTVKIIIEKSIIYTKVIIKDTGEGISHEDLPNIFTRFYKSNKPDSVGIGLSLSKSIVEAHSGSINVSSEIGVGSEFKVIFNNM